ncbi:MAG: sulfotransferase domain-containing protein [Thermodesulfobacteriota bacterium]
MRIAIIGHRRSGCHFFIESIKKNFHVKTIIKSHHLPPAQREVVEKPYLWRLPKNADKKVYIVRDGRDVLTSFYFWCKNAGEFRNEWKHLVPQKDWNSFGEFLRSKVFIHQNLQFGQCRNPVEYWKLHVESWLMTEIPWYRYEDLWRKQNETLKALGKQMNLNARKNADFSKVDKLVGYLPRRGVIGDWENYFGVSEVGFFDAICGDLMERLGYYD